jgi:hypothetical protein
MGTLISRQSSTSTTPGFVTLLPGDVRRAWLEWDLRGSQASHLEGLPPFEKVLKASTIITRVNLELKLADGDGIMMCFDQ